MDFVSDALKKPKRTKKSSTGSDSVEPSAREDDLTEVIDISSADPRMRPWKPMSSSNSLEKGCAISAQKRVGNENGRNEVLLYPDVGSPFPFQRSDKRFRGKEVESKGNHRQNFPVPRSSSSNRSIMRKPDEISSSSNKNKEFYSCFDSGLNSRMKQNGTFCFSDLQGFPSNELNPNPSHSDNMKGKQILKGDSPNDIHHGEPTIRSNRHEINSVLHPYRAASLFEKDLVIIAKEQDSFESYQNLVWRKTQDLKLNKNQLSLPCPRNDVKNHSSSYLSDWRHGSGIEEKDHDQAFSDPVGSRRNHSWKKYVKGEKKCNSLLSNSDETSGSILNQPSISQLHSGTSNLKLEKSDKNRFHGTIIDFPVTSCGNSHGRLSISDNFSANQIESDETFARKLQEQFYRETMGFINMEKVDETIAWSLQQDEDAKAAAMPWKDHSNSVIFGEISSNFNSEVDLETRLDFLEAMEDALENNMLEYDDITSNDSFNETDYEMQFNPDGSIIQHVGSAEINSLPVSLIQNDNNKEACAVCLEIPSVGETMRHLPCLHKFHKMCIDAWLKRKPSCPVCKLNIT
ncbi:uncharacterized protein LOC110029600 isoform X1 [Phalaenopsis equestris]|uniref:uncharacterized protein LOC110029600 isoform X1 n=1 Tax=Phalaenopsis equestris TaxID=78828 RepID=UPI0009E57CDF|nr:uncharacterized protein LOC110029600 isoform X1 [Phalaenopsis equestris]